MMVWHSLIIIAMIETFADKHPRTGQCFNQKISGYYTPGTFQQYVLGPGMIAGDL
jgi:hypothetical protein